MSNIVEATQASLMHLAERVGGARLSHSLLGNASSTEAARQLAVTRLAALVRSDDGPNDRSASGFLASKPTITTADSLARRLSGGSVGRTNSLGFTSDSSRSSR